MAVTYNIKGTTNSSFKVGKQGTGTVYAGGLEANNIQATGNLTVTGNLVVSGTTTTVNSTTIDVQNSLRFEGATSDDFETTLTLVDPTADRTITLPNATGTVVLQDTTDTLSNKTLASPAFSGSVSGNVAFDTSTLFVDADNNRIGIGTTSPGRALTIAGGSQAKISFTEGGVQSIYFGDSGAEFAGYIHYNHNSDELRFVTSGTININGAYTLPTADGSAGQVLATDGSDTVSFSSFGFPKDMGAISGSTSSFPVGTAPDFGALSGEDLIGHDFGGLTNPYTDTDTGILNVVEDTTPQLGGDLDAQSNQITAVSKLEVTNTSTDDSLLITTTEDSSSAGPVITLKRNSSSPADADYLGQLKFKGENDADQEVIYAKITAKILDASDGSEDGIIEFAHKKNGSNAITGRFRSDSLQLLNDTSLRVTGHGEFGVLSSDPGGSAGYAKIYAKDESASAEMFVQDEAGNVTKISPHNEQGEWEYYSRNIKTGKVVRINMEEMIRDIESLTGKNYIKYE
jgi:hypothetical protein